MYEDKIALIGQQIRSVQEALADRKIDRVLFTACGGSLATLFPGKYLIERNTGKVFTAMENAAEFSQDPPAWVDENCLVVLNSQSGNTPETLAAARLAREKGALTVGFTTAEGGRLAQAVDHVILYYDRPEDPYPTVLSIFPCVYRLTYALLDVWNGTALLPQVDEAMIRLQGTFDVVLENFRERAEAGLDYSAAYVLANCEVMESVWKHSYAIHAGEFFHGALEAFTQDTPVIALVGLDASRPLEERAVRFLAKKTQKLVVLDAEEFPLEDYPDFLRAPAAMLVLNRLKAYYIEQIASEMGKSMAERRYMGKEEY